VKEAAVNFNQAIIAHDQAVEIREPGKSSFNFPPFPITPELSFILHFRFFSVSPVRNDKINFQYVKPFSKWIAVIGLIANQTKGAFFRTTSAIARYVYGFERFFGEFDFCGRCRGKCASDRNTLAVDHHHPLRSFAPFGRANKGPPFLAGAKLPSITASCQSSAPFLSSMERNFRQTSSQTPWSSQSLKRR